MDAGFDVTLYEQQRRPGGVWVYDAEPETDPLGRTDPSDFRHAALYASLHTNLPRDLMAFECFTFDTAGGGDDAWPRYPHHTQVQIYLARFADHFDLTPRIRYGTLVEALVPGSDGRWTVHTSEARATFDAAIVCNGHYARPRIPPLPGADEFAGLRMHSKSYREPELFRGMRVALWGAAASGVDISREISGVAAATYWCGDRFEDRAPPREAEPGKVHTCRSPDGFSDERTLAFGEERVEIDAFVYCTGYHYTFAFLEPGVLEVNDNHVGPLYRDIVSATHPNLAFIGIPYLVIPFPLCEVQAHYLAEMWRGAARLPERDAMLAWCREREQNNIRSGVKLRHYHRLAEAQFDYMRTLTREAGLPEPPGWREALADEANKLRTARPEVFRSVDLPHLGPTVIARTSGQDVPDP